MTDTIAPAAPRRLLLIKSLIANQPGYYFWNGRWRAIKQDKPAPKSAPQAKHPHAAGNHLPAIHFSDSEWAQLKLSDTNVNAGTFNGQLEKLKQHSESGNVTAIVGSGYGLNTYGQKLAKIANKLLELHGSPHKVTPGQKAGEHEAVKQVPDGTDISVGTKPAPTPEPTKPAEPKMAAPAFDGGPEFDDSFGKAPYYNTLAVKLKEAADKGHDELDAVFKSITGKAAGGTTKNSKILIAYHKQLKDKLAAKDITKNSTAPAPAPEPEKKPAKTLGELIKQEMAKQAAADKLSKIPWEAMKLPDSNTNAKTHNGKVDQIKAMAEAGDIAGLEAFKAGKNTYGQKQMKLAATAIAALKESNLSAAEPDAAESSQSPKGSLEMIGTAADPSIAEMHAYAYINEQGKTKESYQKAASELAQYGHHKQAQTVLTSMMGKYGPQEGDTKEGADGTLVFKNGRWHKQKQAEPAPEQQAPAPTIKKLKPSEAIKIMASVNAKTAAGNKAKLKAMAVAGDVTGLQQFIAQSKGFPASKKVAQTLIEAMTGGAAIPVAAPKTTSPAAPSVAPGGIPSIDNWQQTGPQGGSNPGGRFKDENGVEWYCKFPSSEDVAKSEVLAAKLYAATGVTGQDAKLITKGGKLGIASRWVDVSKADAGKLAKTDGVFSGFAVDAWLGNWDVVGMGYDNLQVGADGKAVRVDAGGSLEYRAQGGKKAFGSSVIEIDSLRDASINPQAAAVFGKMTQADIAASAAKVANLSDDSIRILVNTYGPGDAAAKKALADTLIARKADIIAKYPKAKKQKVIHFKPEKISEPPSFTNWGGTGKSGPSSKEFLNQANEKAVQAIFAAAKTGKVEAVQNLEAEIYNKDTGEVTGSAKVVEHPSQHVKGYAQQAINEINYQMNPPKRFRFDGGHPLHSLNAAYPSHKGAIHGSAVSKVGKYILLGEPGTVSLDALALPKLTHASGQLTKATYSPAAQAAFAKMPLTQQQAVKAYTGNGYHKMNSSLWDGNPSGEAKAAAEALHTLGHDLIPGTVLSRKISVHGSDLDALMKTTGKVIQEPAIMSTAIRPSSWSGNVQLKLHVGPGVKGLWVGHGSGKNGGSISNHGGEDEIILPPNTRMLVLSTKKSTGTDADGFGGHGYHVIEAVILPTQDHS